MKYSNIIITLITVLFLQSCNSEEKTPVKVDGPTVNVIVKPVGASDSNPFLTASGKIEASNSANLSTRLMGFVNNVHVKVGDKVAKDQLLVSINNTDLQAKAAQVNARITEATVAYRNAEKDFNRFQNLFSENSASQKELDDITARFEMAKAQLEAAKQMKNEVTAQFNYTNIRAPFSGVVTNKFIEVGDMANPGMPLIAIETPGNYEVTAMIPENEISEIKTNTEVKVLVKSINATLEGKVTEVSTSAKNTGGQYLVKVDLINTPKEVLSGMYATVQFPVEKTSKSIESILIQKEAIVTKGQLSGVYTVSQSNTAVLRWLRLGRTYGEQVEVLSGLNQEESYIVSADAKLYNGVKINIQ